MAGIFGIQHYDVAHDVRAGLAALRSAAQQGFDHPSAWHSFETGGIGAAIPQHYSNTKWPLITRDERYALAVFGEIYLSDGTPLRAANFEENFVRPFLASPDSFLLTVDGAFCFTLMSEQECILVSDPFGSFALHYSSTPERFLFASQMEGIRSILKNKSMDETGMHQYLGLAMTLAGRTTYSEISRLAGGTILTASKAGMREQRYFKPSYNQNTRDTTSLLERIRTNFEQSVLRRAHYPDAIAALTGGFDSRTTWSILLKHNLSIPSHTHGLLGCSDLTISTRIANAFQITKKNIIVDEDFLEAIPEHWNDIVRLSEGGISIAHAPTLLVLEQLTGNFSVMLDSYGGTFYRRQRMKVAERMINPRHDLIPQILRYERSPLLRSSLLWPDARHSIEQAAENGLQEYYDSISDTTLLGDKLDMFHFDQVDVMRDALLSNVQMNYIGLAHPFLSLESIKAATMLPLAERRRNAAHQYIVHASFPKLEHFWMDNVGFVTPYRGFSTFRYGAMIAERGLKKAGNIFPKLFGHATLRKPTMDVENLLRPGLGHAKEILLTPHPLFDQFIDRTQLEKNLQELESDNFESGAAIIQLLTFRIFLDLFF